MVRRLRRRHLSSLRYNSNLEWHRGHAERQKEDRQQWTTQEAANVAVGELAGRAWEEEFNAMQPHRIAPHYRHPTVIQMILAPWLVPLISWG